MANQLTGALLGRKAVITFPQSVGLVEYTVHNRLRWRISDKNGNVTQGQEHFGYMQLSENLHFLNWKEQSGFTVSQVINTEAGTVQAMWSYPHKCGHKKSMCINGQFEFA